jgi:hypothetical protein
LRPSYLNLLHRAWGGSINSEVSRYAE